MIEFFKILFFSKMVLLSPSPLDIDPGEVVVIKGPVEAITSGASIYLDITNIRPDEIDNVVDVRRWAEKTFPRGFAKAVLSSASSDKSIEVIYDGGISWGDDKLYLILSREKGIPVGMAFERIQLQSSLGLREVYVYWRNYQK